MATTKMKIKCTDDNTEWEVTWDEGKSRELVEHNAKLADPNGNKGALAAWMACSQCGKNHDHQIRLEVEP